MPRPATAPQGRNPSSSDSCIPEASGNAKQKVGWVKFVILPNKKVLTPAKKCHAEACNIAIDYYR